MLGIGIILAGMGYGGIKKNYGVDIGTASFALSIVAGVCFFISMAVSAVGISSVPYGWRTHPWHTTFIILAFITLITFGITQILCGIALIKSKKYTGDSELTMVTGTMLIVSGALTASMFVSFPGMILFFVSEILATKVFLTSKTPKQTT